MPANGNKTSKVAADNNTRKVIEKIATGGKGIWPCRKEVNDP
ncbi:MAG: hypothetical protein ACM3X1_09570 [Ignavibacteriales bacterium]